LIVELRLHETAELDNGLSIALTAFSHKRPRTGGPTKATAYLALSRGEAKGELLLSVHGVQGKSEAEDGLTDSERYDAKEWNGVAFRLRGFEYDSRIRVEVCFS
jgi:hypothetical protein